MSNTKTILAAFKASSLEDIMFNPNNLVIESFELEVKDLLDAVHAGCISYTEVIEFQAKMIEAFTEMQA